MIKGITTKGIIRSLPRVTITDPLYKKGVWCRYDKDDMPPGEYDYICNVQSASVQDDEGVTQPDISSESMFFTTITATVNISRCIPGLEGVPPFVILDEDGNLCYNSELLSVVTRKIGLDTARLYIGTNTDAGVDDNDGVIHTGSYGICGSVSEFTFNTPGLTKIPNGEIVELPTGLFCLSISFSFDNPSVESQDLSDYLGESFSVEAPESNMTLDTNIPEDNTEIEKRCVCGNKLFSASQVCYHESIVYSDGSFQEDRGVFQSETPYGPFVCTLCKKEYSELDDIPSYDVKFHAP